MLFAQFGLPNMIVTDNATNFTSVEFQEFCKLNGIRHITSSPYHPASNGLAERAIQIVKHGITKMSQGSISDKISRFLFAYRNTPSQLTGSSPVNLLLGRRLKSALDHLKPDLCQRVEERQLKSKMCKDNHSVRKNFQEGDAVFARNYGSGNSWVPAMVEKVTGPVSLTVRVKHSGVLWRRQLDQVRSDSTVPVDSSDNPDQFRNDPTMDPNDDWYSTLEFEDSTPLPDPDQNSDSQSMRSKYPARNRKPPDRLTYSKLGGEKM